MVESSAEKKRLFYLIVLLLTLVVMIIGATFAYFKLVASQKEEGTVLYTGTVHINYIDGTYIDNPVLYPLKSVSYDTLEKVYRNNFAVTSTGTLDQTLKIDLNILENQFDSDYLKYVLYSSNGNMLASGDVPNSGIISLANNVYLEHGATARYLLIIWLKDNGKNQNTEDEKIFSGKIDVTAIQVRK